MAVLFDIHKCSFFWDVFVFKFLFVISWKFSFEISNFLAKIFHVESNIYADPVLPKLKCIQMLGRASLPYGS